MEGPTKAPERASVRRLHAAAGAGALGAGLLALVACGRSGVTAKPPEPGDVAVATVDDHRIWASDVEHEAVSEGVIGEGEPLDASSELFRRVLDEVIDQRLLAAEAVKRKVEDDPATRRRLTAARERILGDTLVREIVAQAINEGAVRGLYEEQKKLSKPSEDFRARQIVTQSQTDAAAIGKLLGSGASFETLAAERSSDPATRFNGGDLGYFSTDAMPDGYAAALAPAQVGDVAGPFKTDAGWVLLKLEDRRAQPSISLDQARPQIVRFLTYDQIRDLLQRLRGKARIKLLTAQPPPISGAPPSAPRVLSKKKP